jgi:ParB-like chromosome segregation protein Spo0J
MIVTYINIERLIEAEWNANVVPPGRLKKIRRSIERFGVVENLVARAHPEQPECFEVVSGNHRLRLLKELGFEQVPVVVVELDDARARLLAQTLNRTRGVDDPKKYAQLLEKLLAARRRRRSTQSCATSAAPTATTAARISPRSRQQNRSRGSVRSTSLVRTCSHAATPPTPS